MLSNAEIARELDGQLVALFDLAAEQSPACRDALAYYIRRRFTERELEVDDVLAYRAVLRLSDRIGELADKRSAGVARLAEDELRRLAEAVAYYISERDVESYQSPEERERLRILAELAGPMREMALVMREAADAPAEPVLAGYR